MATRTQARESVVGLLYAYDLGNEGIVKYVDDILEDKKIRNKQKAFALNLFNGVINNLEKIDAEIITHLDKRGLDDIGSVEKSILMLFLGQFLLPPYQR